MAHAQVLGEPLPAAAETGSDYGASYKGLMQPEGAFHGPDISDHRKLSALRFSRRWAMGDIFLAKDGTG